MLPLPEIIQHYGDRILFAGAGGVVTYRAFGQRVAEAVTAEIDQGPVTLHPLEWSAESFARLLALFEKHHCVCLTDQLPEGDVSPFAKSFPALILQTGGTTGQPKHVVHSVETLTARYAILKRAPQRLLVLYAANHIAGLDAFFQAMYRGGTLVIPEGRDPQSVIHAMEKHQVEVLPATPTFLQFLLLSGALDEKKLPSVIAIPHGAEPMPTALRSRLKIAFPNARLIHRFGLTELGALPVKPDPEDPDALFLEGEGYDWKLVDGELWIKSPTRMLGTLEAGPVSSDTLWHKTGDLAEATSRGSIRILGRRESLINVGGEKIIPEMVEALLLDQPGVLEALVSGAPNPLTGQAVAAQVVFKGEPDTMGLMRSLRGAVRDRGLSLAHVPTRIEAVSHLDKTAFGKRRRHQGKT